MGGVWHGWAGLVFMGLALLFWVGVVALIAWLVARLATRRSPAAALAAAPALAYAPPSAMETLRQRYARGEIDATTFDQMAERLRASEQRERPGEPPTTTLGGETGQV